jgi:hypothetical protein
MREKFPPCFLFGEGEVQRRETSPGSSSTIMSEIGTIVWKCIKNRHALLFIIDKTIHVLNKVTRREVACWTEHFSPLILNLSARCRLVVSFTGERASAAQWIERSVGPRGGLD